MESLRELYRIGIGPSASHTMAPKKAAEAFFSRTSDAARYTAVWRQPGSGI